MKHAVFDAIFEEEEEDDTKDKYLTFRLADEHYGLGIQYVIEIISIQKITDVPDLPDFVKGVINLRGQVIPVMDLRLRFGLEPRAYDDRTCVIITRMDDSPVGLVVDTVNEVRDIPPQNVTAPPAIKKGAAARFIQGFGRIDDHVEILLDVRQLLGEDELEAIGAVGGAT